MTSNDLKETFKVKATLYEFLLADGFIDATLATTVNIGLLNQ